MAIRTLLVTLAAALAACGGATEPTGGAATDASDPGTTATASATADEPTEAAAGEVEAEVEAAFLATVDEALAATAYEGLALADPEGFVAAGEIMCDLLAEGATVDEVLSAYLSELDEARGGLDDDDAILSGAVLGAATGTLCPEHAALVEEG